MGKSDIFNMLLLFIFILLNCIKMNVCLIAYDCEGPDLNTSVISIRDVGLCGNEKSDFEEKSVSVQVIQLNEVKRQLAKTCLVLITRQIFYCGMFSHTSPVEDGFLNYLLPLGREECELAHRHKSLLIYNHHINGLIMNGTYTTSLTLFGIITRDGKCKGTVYNENGKSWENVVVQGMIKIQLGHIYISILEKPQKY